ncbi:MAG TPA: histidine kinase N-terminal 7TM domain-containing protein [Leptospiraceae bacterium]|nr:histidine kinase N-terminal 7TM domain-containing protein [Leptospiraceae bacterium]HNN60567.1 histidine kinase N-terminal 7TM domain-containing protein [Leptospiraceae bacterium]HNN74289.1 histidine kinase N-terminal 7TM domain-containing protein [Leptospiraceae bacterium]
MNAETLALLPAIAAVISVINGTYAFRRRSVRGALYFFLMPLGTAIWSFGYAGELLGKTQPFMTAMDNLEFIGSDLVVIGFFLFAWHYTRTTRPPLFLLAFPVINQIIAWTDTGLLRHGTQVKEMGGVQFLVYDYGPYMWANIAVYYSLLLAGSFLFARRLPSVHGIFRTQIVLMILSATIPWIASLFTVFGLLPIPIPNLDISPASLTVGNLLLTAALFSFGTLRISPLARERTFEMIEEGVLVCDQHGVIVDFNSSAKRLLGDKYSLEIGQRIADELARAPSEYSVSDSSWLQVRRNSLLDSSGTEIGKIYTLQDVTQHRQARRALQDATTQAQNANKAKSIFLANVSHEIRTPLTAILGIAEILEGTKLDEEQKRMVSSFRSAGTSLLETINGLLDLSRIEAGKMQMEARVFSLHEMLENTCRMFRLQIESREEDARVELKLTIAPGVPENIKADDLRLGQILTNIIGNAVKFTRVGKIDVRAVFHQGILQIVVQDTGIGIPKKKIDNIFKPFEQGDVSTTRSFGGTGLGLAIVRELVRLMQGMISVHSVPGQGSVFSVTLPVEVVEGEKKAEKKDTPSWTGSILVAEDNEVIRLILEKHLTGLGMKPTLAENGQEAVQLYNTNAFDAGIFDIQMPVMDGFEAARSIRALEKAQGKRRMPLLALSASAMPEDVQNARDAGFDAHIAKPVTRDQLLNALAKCALRETQ